MKTLIAFYSRRGSNYVDGDIVDLPLGNTEVAAQTIQKRTGGELFRIETVKPYPADYHETTEVSRQELRQKARPALVAPVADVAAFDVVVLGYPNWWGTMPMAVCTFLEAQRWSGKTILPLCTHEGSGLGRSEADLRKLCPGAKVLGGLAIRGSGVRSAEAEIAEWLDASRLFG
ncbi:MAG: flavodoxin [Myxococcales bacterium]